MLTLWRGRADRRQLGLVVDLAVGEDVDLVVRMEGAGAEGGHQTAELVRVEGQRRTLRHPVGQRGLEQGEQQHQAHEGERDPRQDEVGGRIHGSPDGRHLHR